MPDSLFPAPLPPPELPATTPPPPELPARRPPALPHLPRPSLEDLQAVRRAGVAANTLRAYERALKEFAVWCADHGLSPLPPVEPVPVAQYLLALAQTRRPSREQWEALQRDPEAPVGPFAGDYPSRSLIEQHVAAVAWRHRLADFPPPTATAKVQTVLKGIWTSRAGRPEFTPHKKVAALPDVVDRLIEAAGDQRNPGQATRDPALLLAMFSHGLRRSEVAGLFYPTQVVLSGTAPHLVLGKTKTDQQGLGRLLPLHTRVLEALTVWLNHRSHRAGPLFVPVDRFGDVVWRDGEDGFLAALTPGSVARIVKRACLAAGVDPEPFGAHSFRRGFITHAYREGVSEERIQAAVGHKMADTTRGYREEGLLSDRDEWAAHHAAMDALQAAEQHRRGGVK